MSGKATNRENKVGLESIQIQGEAYYKITHVDAFRPFFMSIVSDSNHWMFISSNGGLTAGRKNAEHALFPYYTDDKITESAEITGSKTIFQVGLEGGQTVVWEPFSLRDNGKFRIVRSLYKNKYGNKILFEEENADLGLVFRYAWNMSNLFGFVKKSSLYNRSGAVRRIVALDGVQNIVPAGLGSELQNRASNLADAYKRSELEPESGLGIFSLSAIIVDKAEPSEALKANVAFCIGLPAPVFLLSSRQLDAFRQGGAVSTETDIKGEKGAYLVCASLDLAPGTEKTWTLAANVNQNHAAVIRLIDAIKNDKTLPERIQQDIDLGTENLVRLVASADGLQCGQDRRQDSRHFSNALFNIMRGGIFDNNYLIERADFLRYLEKASREVAARHGESLSDLPAVFSLFDLKSRLEQADDPDLIRLGTEYLPLKFSRRHGDPSRPWNKFSINTRSEVDGSKILDYEGNWRDIFQNWEALALAYPEFIEGMIFKFLNASTFDGYNPYRVTKDGFDWETIEPDDPWSYIGYWGDHQIIYLLKFLEFAHRCDPGLLDRWLDKEYFVYANVPYRIKPYAGLVANPKDTIDFDFALDEKIRERRSDLGADGALLCDENGEVIHVNFVEKILAMLLAKLSNFIPEAGIWMNTQRPEWNDANNALVGNGVSMVTLYYLRRFLVFFESVLSETRLEGLKVSSELVDFYKQVRQTMEDNQELLQGRISDTDRKRLLDTWGQSAGEFREHVYDQSFWGKKRTISLDGLRRFVGLARNFTEQSIAANERKDGLYHGYNLMGFADDGVTISHLSEMLEAQVAVLSSGYLSASDSLRVLDALRESALYRADQDSYLLYPNKALPGFLQKNTISAARIEKLRLPSSGLGFILEQDLYGNYHFNGNFKNAGDLAQALDQSEAIGADDREALLALFEEVFNHKAFTGRSGTFFGYEGLGSIYWHMVSKLRLAVMETTLQAIARQVDRGLVERLTNHYFAIREGIGAHKSPEVYGAFPTDPYSHTPMGKGAQQPGMTGQVKEDLLCRTGELGVDIVKGILRFEPLLLRRDEFLEAPVSMDYYDVQGNRQRIEVPAGALFFTCCQTPVVYRLADTEGLEVVRADGQVRRSDFMTLDARETRDIMRRNGAVQQITVFINPERLW